jgi:hypothetical protein
LVRTDKTLRFDASAMATDDVAAADGNRERDPARFPPNKV